MKLLVLAFVLTLSCCDSARILGVVSSAFYSHQIVFQPLWRELSLRGHQVTTLTTDPIKDPSLVNLTEIDLHFSYEGWNTVLSDSIENTQSNAFKALHTVLMTMTKISELQLQHPDVQKLINDKNAKFDLLIVEYFMPVMFMFAERFNCPYIGMLSVDAPNSFLKLFGHPTHPVLYPDFMLPLTDELSFTDRVKSIVFSLVLEYLMNVDLYSVHQMYVEKFFGTNTLLRDLAENVSLLFVNSDPIFHKVKAHLPNVIQIGGGSHLSSFKPLPQELGKILNNASDGMIYFSLGSNVKSKDIPIETRNLLLSTFGELPYTVLWKFEADDLTNRPKNVIISKWFPQQDVLKHPNIKLFITQGGLQSMDEAVYNHVPIIGMPFVGDQFYNVQKMVNKGFGLSVDYTTLKKDEFKAIIFEVIKNPRYKNRVKELTELAMDQPMTGLEKAVWWTEYVIRHKGAKHLRSPLLDIPAYQYYLLDVIGGLMLFSVVFMYILYTLLKLLLRFIKYVCCSKSKSKIKTN